MTDIKIKTTNPYSGQSTYLTKEEYDLYHTIKDAEIKEDYETVRKGLDWFIKYFPKQYMVLLD